MSEGPFSYDILTYIIIFEILKIRSHLNEDQVDERKCRPQPVICWSDIQEQKHFHTP